MDMSTMSIEGGTRKAPLEELTKDELVKKCRGLLTIAQKAKQARDAIADENAKLKKTAVSEELIESFTQQKLQLVTSVDELQKQNKTLSAQVADLEVQLDAHEEKNVNLDTENQSYKRQVVRLTEENEQLLTHLDGLEGQIDELKKIGLEQQQQLLILEQNNEALAANGETQELQKMLAVSLDEVKKLKDDNNALQSSVADKEATIISLNDSIMNYDFSLSQLEEYKDALRCKDEDIAKQTAITDDLNIELHKNRALVEKLKQDISNKSKKLDANQIECSGSNAELLNTNEKLREKLKTYHGKIVRLAGDVRKVKESKEYILDTFKVYNQQVNDWKNQLSTIGLKLQDELQRNADEKNRLQLQIQQLEEAGEEVKILRDQHEVDVENVKKMEANNVELVQTIELLKSAREQQMSSQTDDEHVHLVAELEGKQNEILELQKEFKMKQVQIEELQRQLHLLQESNNELMRTVDDGKSKTNEYDHLVDELRADILSKDAEFENQKRKLEEFIVNEKSSWEQLKVELEQLKLVYDAQSNEYKQVKDMYESEKVSWSSAQGQFEGTIEDNTRLISELKKAIEKLEKDVECSRATESQQAEQTSEIILQLRQENKSLLDKVEELQTSLETQPTNDSSSSTLKRENAELLAEMNVMNQALKERGETISKQQAHCDEMLKKIQVYEGQLAKAQENVEQLQDELAQLRNQPGERDDDMLSTSTISRCDEMNRMKELEGSWEERYGKLRNYALKLKAKAKELQGELSREQAEKSDMQGRVAGHMKTVQSMQGQLDALQDKLDANKGDKQRLEQLTKDNQRLQVEIGNNEEGMEKLKSQIDKVNQEKTTLDAWKKQVGTKVQALRKELEANTLMRKDFEARIAKLQSELDAKCKEHDKEKEKHQATRSQLHESNNECKKQSVLNLEMQDYERSIKEMSSKLEKKNEQVTKLKNQIDSQKSNYATTKEQNRLLDAKAAELDIELDACRIEIRTFKKQIADLEITIGDKENRIDEVRGLLEATRSENEDLSTQLSKIIAEHQKVNNLLREEKDHFRNENVDLEQRVRQLEDQLKLRTDELTNVNNEYQSYKVRAQSVLRQNQSRDVGVEEKLSEEAATLRAQIQICRSEIEDFKSKLKNLESQNDKLLEGKHNCEVARKEIQMEYDGALVEIDKLNGKHQEAVLEHNETVRSLKLHTETLSQCYRQQISEQEVRHNREIIELQSKYEKNPQLLHHDIPSLIIPTSVREEGEGSESVDSANGNTIHPLEKLLGADQDQELSAVRKQLSENEMRVLHLTALLADTEQDLAKHMQMNKVLKEEIRRQQRSVERERHAENLEYMKNVVFKFITLSNGDERMRLVPVLNTILKLSPEETNKLNLVAKGDKSWSNYLPMSMWPSGGSTSKPQ